jgi:hypothetical protein
LALGSEGAAIAGAFTGFFHQPDENVMAQGVVLFNYQVDPSSAQKRVNKPLTSILVDVLAEKLASSG